MTKRKRTRTDSDLQNTTQKTKARATRTTIKTGDELISHFKTILQPIKPVQKKSSLQNALIRGAKPVAVTRGLSPMNAISTIVTS
jgi:hypothetical protein